MPLFLDDWFHTPPGNIPGEGLRSRYKRLRAVNPWVARHIKQMALEMAARGHRRNRP